MKRLIAGVERRRTAAYAVRRRKQRVKRLCTHLGIVGSKDGLRAMRHFKVTYYCGILPYASRIRAMSVPSMMHIRQVFP